MISEEVPAVACRVETEKAQFFGEIPRFFQDAGQLREAVQNNFISINLSSLTSLTYFLNKVCKLLTWAYLSLPT